jgi:hypothetical protein
MRITLTKKVEFEVTTLKVQAGVRYWEDSEFSGVEAEEDGSDTPCKQGDYWCPVIDIATGKILNWTIGITGNIHYKVCDDGKYTLLDADGSIIVEKDGYVPNCMSPKENGYGDYIKMDILSDGTIVDWNPTFNDFTDEED